MDRCTFLKLASKFLHVESHDIMLTAVDGSECVLALKQKNLPSIPSCRVLVELKSLQNKHLITIGCPHLLSHSGGAGVSIVILHGLFLVGFLDVLEHGILNTVGLDGIEGVEESLEK
mmetsp:Transcript_20557/g.58980  ORF Transcript_20557/g.58980 Transcript_20557/m.58980 type:complete len:117 (-) Transcript_20557:600-950(-)